MSPFSDHPLLRRLRWFREPRGQTLLVVEALCRDRGYDSAPFDADGRPTKLPTDKQLAAELRMSERMVRDHIAKAAMNAEGQEHLDPRVRIWLVYHHEEWLKQRPATPAQGGPQVA